MTGKSQTKVSIITGAGGGIGRECARALAARGGSLVLVDIAPDALDRLSDELTSANPQMDVLCLPLNVCSESDMGKMVQASVDRFGQIDHLVAAAGILRLGKALKAVSETTLDEWDVVMRTNLTGTFLANRAVLPVMLERRAGDIVNISSTSGRQGRPFDGPYCASKFGIIGLSESLAEEVSAYGIRVQTVLPDAVDTPLWEQNPSSAMRPAHALPPERVAALVVYLLELPRDTYLLNPVIAPLKTRRKGRRNQ